MKSVNEITEKIYGNYPEKVLQFGEGNFLRAFVDWMIDKANRDGSYHGSIVLCQPIEKGLKDMINAQDGVYTLIMRGAENGQPVEKTEVITSVSRCISPYEDYDVLMDLARSADLEVVVSNTTEAGIAWHDGDQITDRPPVSFPAKVTACSPVRGRMESRGEICRMGGAGQRVYEHPCGPHRYRISEGGCRGV